MKLDKIKFARLIGYIASITGKDFAPDDVDYIDRMIDIDVEPIALPINLSAVDGLMACMAEGTRKIEAIKYHRSLTGMGLKESKDAVEKYWTESAKLVLNDMLDIVDKTLIGNTTMLSNFKADELSTIKAFINTYVRK